MTQRRGGSGNFAEDKQRAAEAGRKGGKMSGGNFKHDPERAQKPVKGRAKQPWGP
jgi:general stress protein YciG